MIVGVPAFSNRTSECSFKPVPTSIRGSGRHSKPTPRCSSPTTTALLRPPEDVTVAKTGGSILLQRMKNFQIVNGGQTTASIHVAYRGKVNLSRIFVQMKLSVINPERANEVIPKISEFANSQNRVNAADFFANHPFHIRIEGFSRRIHAPSPDGTFRESKWFYERARGQYSDARSLLTPARRR